MGGETAQLQMISFHFLEGRNRRVEVAPLLVHLVATTWLFLSDSLASAIHTRAMARNSSFRATVERLSAIFMQSAAYARYRATVSNGISFASLQMIAGSVRLLQIQIAKIVSGKAFRGNLDFGLQINQLVPFLPWPSRRQNFSGSGAARANVPASIAARAISKAADAVVASTLVTKRQIFLRPVIRGLPLDRESFARHLPGFRSKASTTNP